MGPPVYVRLEVPGAEMCVYSAPYRPYEVIAEVRFSEVNFLKIGCR